MPNRQGILYNRFNRYVSPAPNPWTLIETLTEARRYYPINTTGYTELLVVCNDIVSALFCIRDIGSSNFYEHSYREKSYSLTTNDGYRFTILFNAYNVSRRSAEISIWADQLTSVSQIQQLDLINAKVYVR